MKLEFPTQKRWHGNRALSAILRFTEHEPTVHFSGGFRNYQFIEQEVDASPFRSDRLASAKATIRERVDEYLESLRYGTRNASARIHAQESPMTSNQDRPACAPGSAEPIRQLPGWNEGLHRATGGGDRKETISGPECDRAPVGRPKRMFRTLRPRQRGGRALRDGPHPDKARTLLVVGDERQFLSIGRNAHDVETRPLITEARGVKGETNRSRG